MARIEKNIPVPAEVLGENGYFYIRKYPWPTLQVGESFLIEKNAKSVSNCVATANDRHAPKKFVYSKAEGGFRVWRKS